MSRIILFDQFEKDFTTHGMGVIHDAITCTVELGTDSTGELFMAYPLDGEMFERLNYRRLIFAKPSPNSKPQPYRIYRISTPMSGRVKVYAHHISYDAGGIIVAPCAADNIIDAVKAINKNILTECPFTLSTYMNAEGAFEIKTPRSLREVLVGEKDSLASVYGAEFVFDKFNIRAVERIGGDFGYKIRYGVNLIDANQEKSCLNVYTGIYPFFYEETNDVGTLVTIPGGVLNAKGNFGYTRILPVDLSSEFTEIPTEEQLLEVAQKYLEENDIGVPDVNLDVVFARLREYDEYSDIASLESVELGDTVGVLFDKLGISSKARVVKTVYDCINDRYDSVTIGNVKKTAVDTLVTLENTVVKALSDAAAAGRGVAQVNIRVDEAEALVQLLAEWQTEAETSIAEINAKADANGVRISSVAKVADANTQKTAELTQTVNDLGPEIEAKVSQTGGSTSSFGWKLLTSGFHIYSNGSDVFYVTSSGAHVIGHIEATSGKIGDFSVSNKGLSYGNVLILKDGSYFGANANNIDNLGESDIATRITDDGQMVSRSPRLYFPALYGGVTISGSASSGHAVSCNIPIVLNGYDLSTHEARIIALEKALNVENQSYSVNIVIRYLSAAGATVATVTDVSGTYANGTTFTYQYARSYGGIVYYNTTGGSQTFTVNGAALSKTVTYREPTPEIVKYNVTITIQYLDPNGATLANVTAVSGTYDNGTTFTYDYSTTYNGQTYYNTTGSSQTLTVNGSDLTATVSYKQPAPTPSYDKYLSVGSTFGVDVSDYSGTDLDVSDTGGCLSWYDDGGSLQFEAKYKGSGTLTIKDNENDIVIYQITYIVQ